jgi:hypothetical protein
MVKIDIGCRVQMMPLVPTDPWYWLVARLALSLVAGCSFGTAQLLSPTG